MGFAYFFLRNKRNNEVVDFKRGELGLGLITFPKKDVAKANNQLVELDVSEMPPYYYVTSKLNGNVIDSAAGTAVGYYRNAPPTDNQFWTLAPSDQTKGYFFIETRLRGAGVMTAVPRAGAETEVLVTPRRTPEDDSQLWSIERAE